MCIDEKTWLLAVSLESDILSRVESIDCAEVWLEEHRRTGNSRVAHLAEVYFEKQEQYSITDTIMSVGRHTESKLSAIRGAIYRVLEDYIDSDGDTSPPILLVNALRLQTA